MRAVKQMVTKMAIKEGIRYLEKDPIGNYTKLVNWAERLAVLPEHKEMARNFREFAENDSNWFRLITRAVQDVDSNIQKKFLVNFFVNATITGIPAKDKIAQKHQINIPWAILMESNGSVQLEMYRLLGGRI